MVTALIAVIRLSGIELLDPVDQQHRIAVRQRRHHPPDIERADGGAGRLIVHRRLSGPAAAAAPVRCVWMLGSAAFSAASTSLVTSTLFAAAQRRVLLEHEVGAAPLHHLLIDRAELLAAICCWI